MISIVILSVNALKSNIGRESLISENMNKPFLNEDSFLKNSSSKKRENFLGNDSRKLTHDDDKDILKDSHSDNEEKEVNYNFTGKKEKEERSEDLRRENFNKFKNTLKKPEKDDKKELSSKDALLSGQSTYQAPFSSALAKSDDEKNKNKDMIVGLKKFMSNNEKVASLLNKMSGLLNENKEMLNSMISSKKEPEGDGKNKEKNNGTSDVLDLKVIEVENLDKVKN